MIVRIWSGLTLICVMRGACADRSGARLRERLVHLAEDVQAALARLRRAPCSTISRVKPGDLDVHLDGGDALLGAADLEVHVAEVIFVAEDVGEDGVLVLQHDQAHRDARDRRLDGDAGVHQRERAAADRGHRRRAVRLGDLRDDADRVRELLLVRQHARERALGEVAVADLATARAAQRLRLADREGREVVVEQEALPLSSMRASMRCSSREVPSVVVQMACVSPRLNSVEPCMRGRKPTSIVIGRTVVRSRPSTRWPSYTTCSRIVS